MSERPKRLDRVDARQGKNVGLNKVLMWGLALVIIAFVVVFIVLSNMPTTRPG